jgi:hypothetical protein
MIIKAMMLSDDVERYVNLIRIESAEFIELDLFIFFTIKLDATNSTELSIDEQRDLVILREDYKKRMRKYKKRIDVLKNLNIFILTSIDRFNLIYFRNQKNDSSKIISSEETSRVDESSSKIRDDSQIQRLAESAQTSANESMTVELRKDLCEDEAIEFV